MPGMSDVVPETVAATDARIPTGRAALERHAWQEGFDLLAAADRDDPTALSGDDLEAMASAAFFIAQADLQLELKERAFQRHELDGNALRAGYVAVDIARSYGYAGKSSIASAWARRAERLLGRDGDTYAHGYLALIGSEAAASAGELDRALELAERAVAIGGRNTDPDLTAFAQVNLGSLKIAAGDTTDGLALMEEASIAAVNGELTPFTSGVTACRMIGACRDLTDYRRANEWIEATERYCHRQSLEGFPGVCRIHRAEVAAVSGEWQRAESELERATAELTAYNATPPQADGFYAIGDIRRLRGDFEGAEAALREAHALGRHPQPALALIRLAQGDAKAAATGIDAALRDETWDRWARARLLPAQVEIAIAAGDLVTARQAVDELSATVQGYPSPALEAGCRVALGRVLLAENDATAAVQELRTGLKRWREVGAPYEVARAQTVISDALRMLGDEDTADLELRAALEEFRRLGARTDVTAAERALRDAEDRRHGASVVHLTFLFTDVVGSTTLAETLGDQPWERLLRWHDDTLRGLVERGGGEIVKTTGDGIFAAFTDARAGLDAAVAIQRALQTRREETGVALSVRIGLHTADAYRRGNDYLGLAVHLAARIQGLAGADEILASAETVAEAGDVAVGATREAMVKGATAPVTVAVVPWD
jgi:class 3 adenylate cyclase